jgi:TolB-like protein
MARSFRQKNFNALGRLKSGVLKAAVLKTPGFKCPLRLEYITRSKSMRKGIIALVLLLAAAAAFGQTKPALGILPFTGGTGRNGDTIANLFANSSILAQEFRIVPRTSGIDAAIIKEQRFQKVGLTDSDTIAELGKKMGAGYVVAGHITRLGNRNLLLISIISVEKLEQIAGDHREYAAIEDIHRLLPDMAAAIVTSVQKQGSPASGALAVMPLDIQDPAVEQNDAELLAQILATEIANIRHYRVLPRTRQIERVINEQKYQRLGLTDPKTIAAVGKATNAQYVLAGTITKLGSMNLFDVKILDITTGEQIIGRDREYRNLTDGIEIMRSLARDVTGITEAEARAQRAAETKAAEELRIAEKKKKAAKAKLFSLGVGAGSTFTAPWFVANISGTASLLQYTFFDLGVDAGFIHGYKDREDIKYFSLYPYGHLNGFLPAADFMALYIGAGAGLMAAFYNTGDEKNTHLIPTIDLAAGLYLGSKNYYIKLAYSLSAPFDNMLNRQFFSLLNHKALIGYSFRLGR